MHAGDPAQTVGGTLLAVTSDDGPIDEVMEILNRHNPATLDQHTQRFFDIGDAALAQYVPTFDLRQGVDEALGPEDWATAQGKGAEKNDPDDCTARRADDPHELL